MCLENSYLKCAGLLVAVVLLSLTAGCGFIFGESGGGLTPGTCSTTTVSEDITSDTTWANDASNCVEYTVTSGISVTENSVLTVEPGTKVEFEQDAGLSIDDKSALNAVGTDSKPITFTGTQKSRGFWSGLLYDATKKTENALEYVVVEYGGSKSPGPGANFPWSGNIAVHQTGASLSIKETTLRGAEGYGLVTRRVEFRKFQNNTLTSNSKGAALLRASGAQFLDASSDYSGNDRDIVQLVGDGNVTTPSVESGEQHTWANINVPYRVKGGSASVRTEGSLTIEPGATVVFGSGGRLSVEEGGSLTAVGETNKQITFTGKEEVKGFWNGIFYHKSNSADNRLKHATVEYGGGANERPGNIVLKSNDDTNSRLEISDSKVRNSAGYGIYLPTPFPNREGDIKSCDNVEFSGNASGASNVDCPNS